MSDQYDIIQVVQKSIALKKRGTNYIGLCPFHNEKTPSFNVSPSKNIFKCFGCGKGGTAIDFLMGIDKITREEAIARLSETGDEAVAKETLELIFKDTLQEFDNHVKSVNQLINFDRIIVDFCLDSVKSLEDRIRNNGNIEVSNLRLLPVSTIQALETIKANDSLRTQYSSVFNQCLVLLVSYFSSIARDIFRRSVDYMSKHQEAAFQEVNENMKLSLNELSKFNFDLRGNVGQLIIDKQNISFQDMQSANRSFNLYFNLDLERNHTVDVIILGQAARHCIVHSSEVVDQKFLKQTRDINDRGLLKGFELDKRIECSPEQISTIADSMKSHLKSLTAKILERTN